MIKPEKFFDIANKIIQNFEDEAAYRTAISRYYYAAFLKIRIIFIGRLNEIKSKNIGLYNFIHDNESRNPHRFFILLISLKNKFLAELLYSLRTLRNISDYDLHKSIEIKHVNASEKFSNIIIKKADETIQKMFYDIQNNNMAFYAELSKILNKANEILESFRILLKSLGF